MRFSKKFVKLSVVAGLVGSAFMPAAGCSVSPELLSALAQAVLSSAQNNGGFNNPFGGNSGPNGGFQNGSNLAYGADGPAASDDENDNYNNDFNVE